jgi:uncharacterized membrane protein
MKTSTKYGLIAGILAGSWLIGEHFWEIKNPGVASFAGYIGYLIYFSFIFLSIWTVREKEKGGSIDFKTAMQTGVLTCVFYALVLGLFTLVNYKFINTEYFVFQNPNASPQEIANSKNFFRILKGVILIVPINILFGTVISAVFSVLMRRTK